MKNVTINYFTVSKNSFTLTVEFPLMQKIQKKIPAIRNYFQFKKIVFNEEKQKFKKMVIYRRNETRKKRDREKCNKVRAKFKRPLTLKKRVNILG